MGPTQPRVGSNETIKALGRLGFKPPKNKTKGTHVTLRREATPDSTVRRCTVAIAKSEIPGPTLARILTQAEVSLSEFLIALGGSYKKAELLRLKTEEKQKGPRPPR